MGLVVLVVVGVVLGLGHFSESLFLCGGDCFVMWMKRKGGDKGENRHTTIRKSCRKKNTAEMLCAKCHLDCIASWYWQLGV